MAGADIGRFLKDNLPDYSACRHALSPISRHQARGRVRWNTSGLYGMAEGGGEFKMCGFIAPMMCISQGLQSNFRV
jgi:hypothetical protein